MKISCNIQHRKVGLFVTCLANMFRPSAALASAKLLELAGCTVQVPESQVCCGQPAYNGGDRNGAKQIAKQVITVFDDVDYVIVPSGSCAGMLKHHYPLLFKDDTEWETQAHSLANKTFELTDFLVNVCGYDKAPGNFKGRITFHDSCSGLRELNIKEQPRKLLRSIAGLELIEHTKAETCCGFGGAFCVKYPDISDAMVTKKAEDIISTNIDTLVACDLGCLINIAGKLSRIGSDIHVRHVAEILAGDNINPAIGEG